METEELQALVSSLKALAHESRLRILGLVAAEPRSVGELAELLDLKEPTVSHHLAVLQNLDLVNMQPRGTLHLYRLNADALQHLSRNLMTPEQVASLSDGVGGDAWEDKVLRTYLIDDRLTKIPETRKKRDVVLRWLAHRFEDGVRYPEAQLNEIIKLVHPDAATLRRELVGARLMQRENGVYWLTPRASA
jgi:hypothetical protein